MRKPKEFYVLLKGYPNHEMVYDINWSCHGKKGVYVRSPKENLDKVIKVREVLPKRRKSGRK